jgi:peroxiredoxin
MTLRTAVVRGDELSDGELLDARVCNCCGTSAVTTRRGPLLAYRDRRDGEIRDIALLGRAGRGWSKPRLVHADGWSVPGCPVNGPALAADGDRLAVAWYTYVDQRARVRLALSRDAGATLSDPIEVDSPSGRRAPIGRVDVVLDGDGAVVSWLASEREDALLLAARVAADGRVGDPLTVARISASRESGFPQLERLGDELVLAWTEAGKPSRVAMQQLRVNDLPAPRARRSAADSTSTVLAVGSEVPDYRARLLDGSSVSLSSLRGEVVLLNLWATWCEPCRQEVDELSKLHARYAARGVRIVAVSVDGAQRADEVRSFVERRKLPYTIWRDPEDHASSAFGVATLPANFVIDRSGTVRWSQAGALTADDEQLARALDVALKRTP